MYKNKFVMVCIPSGRKRYMELLLPQIRACAYVDKILLWVNTGNTEDLDWMQKQTDCEMVHVAHRSGNVGRFFVDLYHENTIFIKIDDDVVYIEPGALEKLIECRYRNKYAFLVMPAIVNTTTTTYHYEDDIQYNNIFDHNAWMDGDRAVKRHCKFLQQKQHGESVTFPSYYITNYAQQSICVMSWRSEDYVHFLQYNDVIKENDELFLSAIIPRIIQRPVFYFGKSLFSHFAYHGQREIMDRSCVLQEYKQLICRDYGVNIECRS